MIVFGFALTSAIILTSHKRADVEYACPSQCFIMDLNLENIAPKQWKITTIVLLWLGYGIIFADIFGMKYCTKIGSWKVVAVFRDYVFSNVGKVMQLMVWFALGMCWAIIDRQVGQYEMDPDRTENSILGFGQLLPLFLILIPIFSAVTTYLGRPHFITFDDLEGTNQERRSGGDPDIERPETNPANDP